MKVYYLANARMPNEKAYGIQMAKMCEALIEQGIDLTLVVPNRRGTKMSLKDFFELRVAVPVIRLPTIDLYVQGRFGYACSSVVFMCMSALFVLYARLRYPRCLIYAIDMDAFSHCLLPLFAPVVAEVHSAKKRTYLGRIFFSKVRGVIATNRPIADALASTFTVPIERMLVEHNGVDASQYMHAKTKDAARLELGFPYDAKIALYVGRFYTWKGLAILSEAAKVLAVQGVRVIAVGGSKQLFEKLFVVADESLEFVEDVHSARIPIWLLAADVLLILGTKAGDESYRYTSPMKIYEYAAAKRSIVASDTPALRDPLTDEDAFFYEPDNAQSLIEMVQVAITSADAEKKILHAYENALTHTWAARAARIQTFMESKIV